MTTKHQHGWKVWIVVNVITAIGAYKLALQEIAFLIGRRTDIVPIFEGRDYPSLSKFMLGYYLIGFIISCAWALNGIERLRRL